MFINQTKESLTVGELLKLLKDYPKDSIVLFQDLTFNSSKKQPVMDIVIREEEYLRLKGEKRLAIMLLNKEIRLPRKTENEDNENEG